MALILLGGILNPRGPVANSGPVHDPSLSAKGGCSSAVDASAAADGFAGLCLNSPAPILLGGRPPHVTRSNGSGIDFSLARYERSMLTECSVFRESRNVTSPASIVRAGFSIIEPPFDRSPERQGSGFFRKRDWK
jgi:hypothetical protein